MSGYAGAVSNRKSDETDWLFVQFAQACMSLRDRSINRRGPFLISDEELADSRVDASSTIEARPKHRLVEESR